MLLLPFSVSAEMADQHSVEAIVAALKSPIPQETIKQARDFDDKLLSEGQNEGSNVYLVTDERSVRVNTMAKKLLEAMGEDSQHWVVRVLDTNPQKVNAFVVGGKYIYVYTGLINEAASDDELAFILSHEMGHSLMNQKARQSKDDIHSTIAGIALIGALLSKKYRNSLVYLSNVAKTSYSRLDEEEADTFAVAISLRAGYDPLRGVDFFSRIKRKKEKYDQEKQQSLNKLRQEVQQEQATCQQMLQIYNSYSQYQTQGYANRANAVCHDAENKRIYYNQTLKQYNLSAQQQQANSVLSDHPAPQNRIAAVAALTDYLHKRRDIQSLSRYQQSYRVMLALQKVHSVLLQPPVQAAATPSTEKISSSPKSSSGLSLSEQLKQIKLAYDQGFITKAEYEQKRQKILSRF